MAPSLGLFTVVFLTLASMFDNRALYPLLELLVAYGVVAISATLSLAGLRNPGYVLALVGAFPMIHLGYGAGFIWGIAHPWPLRGERQELSDSE
jgi:hypothetical protein